MTTQNTVSSKGTSHKRPINKFLFEVVHNFTLVEFKKYTNFPDSVTAEVMLKMMKQPDVPDPFSLHDRIRHNFKKLPDENWWKRGLFNDLKLKAKFYRSDLAKRIFKKMYGLKNCAVPTERLVLPTESGHSVNLKERLEVPSQIEPRPCDESTIINSSPKGLRLKDSRKKVETVVSIIKSRTKSSIHSSPLKTSRNNDNVVAVPLQIESFDDNIAPKRRFKHPGKRMRTDISMPSGIRFYTSRSKFVEQIPTPLHPEGFNDENFISPTEPAPVSSKRDTIISDIVLVPATPLRDGIVRCQLPNSNLQSKRNRPSKRNIVPITRVHQRGVVYEEETEELSVRLPLTDVSNENSIFLSAQLNNSAFSTAKIPDHKSALMATDCIATSPLVLKRLSQNALNQPVNKQKRPNETVKHELHWKIMDLRSITFKPLGNYTFHLEMQLRNDYDTFHIRDQSSIKRILHLSNDEWEQVAKVLTTLNGYRYDSSAVVKTTRAADLLTSVMDCFVRSVPIFVRSSIQFQDFMGHCLEVSEPQPLRNVCVDAAIDPNILKKMGELKRQLNGEN